MHSRLLAVCAGLMLGACIVGGDDDTLDSAYATASVSVAATTGIADGQTPVLVTVTGTAGASLKLQVIGQGGLFVAPDSASAQEKTIFLQDDGTGGNTGVATANVISTEARVVTVALKADSVRTAHDVAFAPVRMAAGPAVPVRLAPGKVVHDVCVAVNSAYGTLQAEALTVEGEFTPVAAEVRSQPPAGMSCPSAPIDAFGWNGYAVFTWATAADFAQVVMSYHDADNDQGLATELLSLEGEAFAGYELTPGTLESNESWTAVDLTLAYPDTGPLGGGPAGGVQLLDIRFIPESGPVFLGSSSGGAEDAPMTDLSGHVELFFDTAGLAGTYALFVTPQSGAASHVIDISVF